MSDRKPIKETVNGNNTVETRELEKAIGQDPMVVMRRRNPIAMLWRSFLFLVRIPEKILGTIYRYSPVRMLLYKMEWYRDIADQTEIETILEDTYGGASSRLMKLRHFIRKNVLFSVLFCIGVYIVGTNTLPLVLHHPTVRVALGKPLVDSDSRIEEIKIARQSSKSILKRRGDLRAELEHCAVGAEMRMQLLSNLDAKAKFADPRAASTMAVVRRFTGHLETYDIEKATELAERRSAVAETHFADITGRITAKLASLDAGERQMRSKLVAMQDEKRAIDARGGVGDINESIKLRDDIDQHKGLIELGPIESDVASVIKRANELLEQVREPSKAPIVDALDRVEPAWMEAAVSGSDSESEVAINVFISEHLTPMIDKLGHPARPAIASAVLDLSKLMEEMSVTLHRLRQSSKGIVDELVRRQDTANTQISRFLGVSSDRWLDHNRCVDTSVAAE